MAKVKVTTPEESREVQLAKLDDELLECRADGHWWKTEMVWGGRSPGTGARDSDGRIIEGTGRIVKNWSTWVSVCQRPRCETTRTIVRTAFMDERLSRYDYPDEYRVTGERPKGLGVRKEARQELARRQSR